MPTTKAAWRPLFRKPWQPLPWAERSRQLDPWFTGKSPQKTYNGALGPIFIVVGKGGFSGAHRLDGQVSSCPALFSGVHGAGRRPGAHGQGRLPDGPLQRTGFSGKGQPRAPA